MTANLKLKPHHQPLLIDDFESYMIQKFSELYQRKKTTFARWRSLSNEQRLIQIAQCIQRDDDDDDDQEYFKTTILNSLFPVVVVQNAALERRLEAIWNEKSDDFKAKWKALNLLSKDNRNRESVHIQGFICFNGEEERENLQNIYKNFQDDIGERPFHL